MNILFYRYGSICEPDIISAFSELGHSVSQITEEMTNKSLTLQGSIKLVSDFLLDHPMDCVFSINFFPHLSEVCQIFKIRYLSWVVDSPVMELYSTSIQNSWNRVFLFDYSQYEEFHPLNPDCVYHLPLATNVVSKDALIWSSSEPERQRFQSEISFLGSLYTEKCPYDKLHGASEQLYGYLDGIMAAQMQVYGYYFIEDLLSDDVVAEFKAHLPGFYQFPAKSFLTDRITMSQLYIGNKISALERVRTLNELAEHFPVTIYTGSDTSVIPKVENRGLAKTLTEMPLVFWGSKINLNITSKAIRSGISLRIWDILGSGGFVLSNFQNEIPEFLSLGVDLDCYGSLDELREKCAYYLTHEKERAEIAHTGYEIVKEKHTFPIRVNQLLQLAFER